MERVKSTKFLGIHLTDKLTSRDNASPVIKKAQQRLHFLRRLKKVELPIPAMILLYSEASKSEFVILLWLILKCVLNNFTRIFLVFYFPTIYE